MKIFAAVFDKKVLDPLLKVLDKGKVKFLGTEGTVKYLKQKGFSAKSVVTGFDFNGRLKSIDKRVFAAILADKSKKKHLDELKRLKITPIDLVIIDLYAPNKKIPESMDIGGQALIRATIKNYKNVTLAFDKKSILDLAKEIRLIGSTSFSFRKSQAKKGLKFITQRTRKEEGLF